MAMWHARTGCLLGLIQGGSCEATATDLTVQQAHLRALDRIDRLCTSHEAQALGFLLKYEAQTDMDVFCHAVEDALVSAVYGPAMKSGAIVDETTARCITATAQATSALLRIAYRTERRALDRIALRKESPSDKQVLLDHAANRITAVRTVLAERIASTCSSVEFNCVYHRDAAALLATIAGRADCLVGATYVQNALVCPVPECGNGMKETGEQCDDGNRSNGDGCSSRCTIETPPSP